MRRKTFDAILSAGGVLLTLVLVAAGALAFWGYSYANGTVTNQLSAQKITFPPKSALTPQMIPYLEKYAGEQLTTGAQAEAYANHFIFYHLQEIGGGKTYSQLSGYAMSLPKGSPAYTAAEAKVQTVFQGTTLRSMLLNAYGWWKMGQLALIGSIVSFCLAGAMGILSLLGLRHFRRVPITEEFPRIREDDLIVVVMESPDRGRHTHLIPRVPAEYATASKASAHALAEHVILGVGGQS